MGLAIAMAIPSDIGHRHNDAEQSVFERITPMEREILRCMTEKRITTTKAIADRLFVSDRTIQKHLQNLFDKTNLHDRTLLCLAYMDFLRPKV